LQIALLKSISKNSLTHRWSKRLKPNPDISHFGRATLLPGRGGSPTEMRLINQGIARNVEDLTSFVLLHGGAVQHIGTALFCMTLQ